jgi:hypothetical protein
MSGENLNPVAMTGDRGAVNPESCGGPFPQSALFASGCCLAGFPHCMVMLGARATEATEPILQD